MKNMKFDVQCVRDCLVANGRVFTVRKWKSYEVESFVEVSGVGECRKVRIGAVRGMSDIARYVKLSGFATVEEWWGKVASFGACAGWLYLVTVLTRRKTRDAESIRERPDKVAGQLMKEKYSSPADFDRMVEVYDYVQSGDKMKRIVVGKAEIISRDAVHIPKDTTKGLPAPLVCREFCERSSKCRLVVQGIGDLCGLYRKHHGKLVKPAKIRKIEKTWKPEVMFVKSAPLSLLRASEFIPESALAVPGTDEKPATWEDYSVTPFMDSYDEIALWGKPEEECNLRAAEIGYEFITKKRRKQSLMSSEARRRQRFLSNHGFRLKDELKVLMIAEPTKARKLASKLTFEDWKTIDRAGGLGSP